MIATEEAVPTPPKRFRTISRDILQIRTGGGAISLFGLPFLAAGVFLILTAAGAIPFDNADEIEGWFLVMIVVMAIAFTSVGGGIVFGRKWCTLDRGRGSLVTATGLLVPMKRKELNLRQFDTVRLDLNTGDSDSPDQYPVTLTGSGNTKPIRLIDGREYAESRTQAVYLAEFLRLPLEDATTDHSVRLAPEQLHRSYRDRDIEAASVGVVQPMKMRCQVERGNGRLVISVPRPDRKAITLLALAVPAVAALYFGPALIEFFEGADAPEELKLILIGFAALIFVLPAIGVLRALINSRRPATIVTIDREAMTIEERVGRRKTTTIQLEDILDIDYGTRATLTSALDDAAKSRHGYPSGYRGQSRKQLSPGVARAISWIAKIVPSKGITVKSVVGLHSFGEGLPDDEIRYLHSLVSEYLRR